MKAVSVVILSAGAGTRMKSSTPKVLHKICGREMLLCSIDEALKLSDDVHIVLFHESERIKKRVLEAYSADSKALQSLHFHIQDHARYPGTGGALMRGGEGADAKKPLAWKYESVLILNGDMPLVRESSLRALCEMEGKIVMSYLHLSNPSGYGRVELENGKVRHIIEQKDATPSQLALRDVNAGVYKLHSEILESYLPQVGNANNQSEYYLTDVLHKAREAGEEICAMLVEEEEFMGVNSKPQLALAQEVMLTRLRNAAMEQGVIMHLPHTIYIESGVRFYGECVIEQGVQILGECEIRSSHIKAHSVVESSVIDSSDVGPLAHIRPKSFLRHTHIGNFVETKSSTLEGVKAGHLSYLGDCEIGEGSNVGAGVITCNYDGRAKHKTTIGKNVFIGSDVQLIAPVNIESQVLIGAGSTISKDIARGSLALTRVPQQNIAGGFFRFFPQEDSKESKES